MFRSVIFDLDGTLVDSIPGIQWSVEAALAACSLPPLACDLKPLIGPPIREILATVSGIDDPATLDRMVAAFRVSYDSHGWRKTAWQPGTAEALARLHASACELWVVTNKPGHAARAILGELAPTARFQEIVSRDSRVPGFASKGEMLADLIARRGMPLHETVMVGDTLKDALAAEEAQVQCVLVAHGYGGGLGGPLPGRCRNIRDWEELLPLCGVSH